MIQENPLPTLESSEKVLGFSSFRPLQEEIIRDVVQGKDVLGIMTTGGRQVADLPNQRFIAPRTLYCGKPIDFIDDRSV